MKILIQNIVLFKLFLAYSLNALGDATESSIQITATVEPACTLTASNLNFGPYNYAASNETATLGVLCTNGTKFRIAINQGGAQGASENNRGMSNGGNILRYYLYTDPGMRIIWGSDSSNSISGNGTGKIQYFRIYGKIPENQKLTPGLYRDNVLITVIVDGLSGFGYQLSIGMALAATIRP